MSAELTLTPTEWMPLPGEESEDGELAWLRVAMGECEYALANEALGGDWSLCNEEGKLQKRVGNAWFKLYATSIPRGTERVVERYVNTKTSTPSTWRITEKLDWPMDSHGSTSSCLWTGNRHIRATLVAVGSLGVLFRNHQGTGVGRAFAIPYHGAIVVSNARGPYDESKVCGLLAQHLGVADDSKQWGLTVATAHGIKHMGGYPHRFYLEGERVLGKPKKDRNLSIDGCYCSAKFSNCSTEGMVVCEHCPFNREAKWNQPSPFSANMEEAE